MSKKREALVSLHALADRICGSNSIDQPSDDQLELLKALEDFKSTNPLTSQVSAVESIIHYAFKIGRAEQFRKVGQSMKDAALEFWVCESARKE